MADKSKINILGLAFILLIAAIAFAGAEGSTFVSTPSQPFANSQSSSFVNYPTTTPSFNNYYSSSQISSYWPILGNSADCKARQDLLLQVSPLGCTPAVVSSDLLAQQDVPVFCQVQAAKINPLIDVKEITNIRFSGNYPKEVSGVGFHPARVALSTGTGSFFGGGSVTGSPVVNNIGYAVVVLRRTVNESSLPNSINVVLNGGVEYNTGNILGVGQSQFRLKEVNDADLSGEKIRQSFWNGKYFVRALDIEVDKAIIAIYDGMANKIAERTVNRGETSSDIYLPGGYCQLSLGIAYDGIEADQNSAKIEVTTEKGTDTFDVFKTESFLNGKCSVKNINTNNTDSGTIQILCGSQRIDLSLKALAAGGQALKDSDLGNADAEDAFKKAIEDYEKVASDYPNLKKDSTTELYALEALQKAELLAGAAGKSATRLRLINEIIDKNLDETGSYKLLRDSFGTTDYSLATKTVNLDNSFTSINLKGFSIASKKSSATLFIDNTPLKFEVGAINTQDKPFGEGSSLQVTSINVDRVGVTYVCSGSRMTKQSTTIVAGHAEDICNRAVRLESDGIEMAKVAKVRILPKAQGTNTETNLSITIGVEKRAIKLSPEKTKERIQNLDASINKLTKISNALTTSVKALKTACFATSAILTFKNLISGFSGGMMARNQVMRGENGWTAFCTQEKSAGRARTLDDCYLKHSDEIAKDVSATEKTINSINKKIDEVEKNAKQTYGVLGLQESVNSDKAKAALAKTIRESSAYGSKKVLIDGKEVLVSELLKEDTIGSVSYSEVRDLYMNLEREATSSAFSDVGKKMIAGSLAKTVSGMQSEIKIDAEMQALQKNQATTGLPAPFYAGTTRTIPAPVVDFSTLNDNTGIKQAFEGSIEKVTTTVINSPVKYTSQLTGEEVAVPAGVYALGLRKVEGSNNDYKVVEAVRVEGNKFGGFRVTMPGEIDDFRQSAGLNGVIKPSETITYNYPITNAEVKYYDEGTFKGMPAVVPFDVKNGWYAATKQTLPALGGLGAFDASGKVASFYLCNAGKNGRIEFEGGFGEDEICQMINLNTGQSLSVFPGLSESQAKDKIAKATKALSDAANQYGRKSVSINGNEFKVGKPAIPVPNIQCQDFMSPEECLLLYNLCDPVICPRSRCDFGGSYPVADVIQSGIIGSTLLCLPNIQDPVVIPVCLSGIQAGFDSYISVLQAHKKCLNDSLSTGAMNGICDQLYSVYLCKLLWEQVAPLANELLPKLVSLAYGQGTRGGGEYLTVNDAWKKTDDSMKFFTNYYGVDVMQIFKAKAATAIGGEVCKSFISAKVPTSFESAIGPRSPPQYTAWFSSSTYTSATVPATAQYNVYYHIFAGKDEGAYYNVYLKTPATSSYYNIAPTVQVASGFINKGDNADETKVFTAPEGYQELCVNVNAQEKCGFKQVTTSFAIDSLAGVYANEQATEKGITTESGCISGTLTAGALLSPGSIQSRISGVANPQIYNSGVTRICSSQNPGSSINPARFVEVGFCDDEKIKCWLDENSLKNAFSDSNQRMLNATMADLNQITQQNLQGQGYLLGNDEASKELTDLQNGINAIAKSASVSQARTSADSVAARIDFIFDKFMIDEFKAQATLLKGKAREEVVNNYLYNQPGAVEKVEPAAVEAVAEDVTSSFNLCNSEGKTGTCKLGGCASGESEVFGVCENADEACCIAELATEESASPDEEFVNPNQFEAPFPQKLTIKINPYYQFKFEFENGGFGYYTITNSDKPAENYLLKISKDGDVNGEWVKTVWTDEANVKNRFKADGFTVSREGGKDDRYTRLFNANANGRQYGYYKVKRAIDNTEWIAEISPSADLGRIWLKKAIPLPYDKEKIKPIFLKLRRGGYPDKFIVGGNLRLNNWRTGEKVDYDYKFSYNQLGYYSAKRYALGGALSVEWISGMDNKGNVMSEWFKNDWTEDEDEVKGLITKAFNEKQIGKEKRAFPKTFKIGRKSEGWIPLIYTTYEFKFGTADKGYYITRYDQNSLNYLVEISRSDGSVGDKFAWSILWDTGVTAEEKRKVAEQNQKSLDNVGSQADMLEAIKTAFMNAKKAEGLTAAEDFAVAATTPFVPVGIELDHIYGSTIAIQNIVFWDEGKLNVLPLYYRYNVKANSWEWSPSKAKDSWVSINAISSIKEGDVYDYKDMDPDNQKFIPYLKGKSFSGGVVMMMRRVMFTQDRETIRTEKVIFKRYIEHGRPAGFTIKIAEGRYHAYMMNNGQWQWVDRVIFNSWIDAKNQPLGKCLYSCGAPAANWQSASPYDGASIIFVWGNNQVANGADFIPTIKSICKC